MFNMGPTYKRLVIDYSSMVKLSDIDYKPLEGDTYSTYQTEAYYFSSDLASLKNNIFIMLKWIMILQIV